MIIAILSNPIQVGDVTSLFPDTSFPSSGPSVEWLAANNAALVVTSLPYDSDTQVSELVEPYLENGTVYTVRIREKTPEELAAEANQKKEIVKAQAVSLLTTTDWVDLPSVTDPSASVYLDNKADFDSYRLTLRLIAVNPPVVVDPWPTKPQENWKTN